jgi:geranylgeranyl transferase type-2 subunit beta
LDSSKDLNSIGKYLTEHLKVSGAYWSLTSLAALNQSLPEGKLEQIVGWLKNCQNSDGGFGGNVGHDSHITSTHYAILILLLFDRVKYLRKYKVKSTFKRL